MRIARLVTVALVLAALGLVACAGHDDAAEDTGETEGAIYPTCSWNGNCPWDLSAGTMVKLVCCSRGHFQPTTGGAFIGRCMRPTDVCR